MKGGSIHKDLKGLRNAQAERIAIFFGIRSVPGGLEFGQKLIRFPRKLVPLCQDIAQLHKSLSMLHFLSITTTVDEA